ncbi:MAG: hypothetical protein Q4B85_12320 [Lachnospiraceae bacterium]|nr:hypothetical protein [Lachnospiraceae bacterium]
MKEELIRIENGEFLYEGNCYRFDLELSRGECVGVFTDDHVHEGTVYEGIFGGKSLFRGGRAFVWGKRVSSEEMAQFIRHHVVRLNRYRFTARESNVTDFLLCLGPDLSLSERRKIRRRLESDEASQLKKQMGITCSGKEKLIHLSVTEYYKLAVFRAWLRGYSVMILDRISEILPSQDLEDFMYCVRLLLGQGMGCIMLEINEDVLFNWASRIDVLQNRRLCFRLEPEEYDERLYRILGWRKKMQSSVDVRNREPVLSDGKTGFSLRNLVLPGKKPVNLEIQKGEIALFRDEHLEVLPLIKKCILEGENWILGDVYLGGSPVSTEEFRRMIGREICIQTELPDRDGGILFENLSGLENLAGALIPKTGRRVIRKNAVNSILKRAEEAFSRELLLKPVAQWSHPDRLKLIYYRWYLQNPKVLICLMPFSGQEAAYHEMILDMLVECAGRGMAILLVSSGVDRIYEKTENQEFRKRLKIL